MKKLLAFLCALALSLSTANAQAAQQTVAGRFTITYDENAFEFDDTLYANESWENQSATWLCMLQSDDITFDAEAELLGNEYAEFSLLNATEEERQSFIEVFLDFYADNGVEYVDTILTDNDQIPFFLYTLTDSVGPYYYAETILGGECTGFSCYYNKLGRAPDDALRDSFVDLLKSFVPTA